MGVDRIELDGELVACRRRDVLAHVVKMLASGQAKKEDELVAAYREVVDANGLSRRDDFSQPDDVLGRQVRHLPNTLATQGRMVRYWDFGEHDVSELVDRLDWEHFRDREFSAQAFFSLQPALLDEFDLHNGHELHNVLRQYAGSGAQAELPYRLGRRSPVLFVGEPEGRDAQVVELARRMAPATTAEIAAAYEEAYGVPASTFVGNYAAVLRPYLTGGVVDFSDADPLGADVAEGLAARLDRDWYSLEEADGICGELDASWGGVDAKAACQLGFVLYSDCIVRKSAAVRPGRAGLTSYYDSLVSDGLLRTDDVPSDILAARSFQLYLWHAMRMHRLYDCGDGTWVSSERLEGQGIGRDAIEGLYKDVASFARRLGVAYVTLPYVFLHAPELRRFGTVPVGLYESLMTSVALEGSFTMFKGRRLLRFAPGPAEVRGFLLELSGRLSSDDPRVIRETLGKEYGIEVREGRIREYLTGAR